VGVDADLIGVSELNRDVNIIYCHGGIGHNIQHDGFDPDRPKPGLLVRLTKQEAVLAAVKYNKELIASQPSLWPPIQVEKVVFECLGGNHITVTIRCFKSGVVSCITGKQFSVSDDAELLAVTTTSPLKYTILKDTITTAEKAICAEYLNADQNQNSGKSETQLMREIQHRAKKMLAESGGTVIKPSVLITDVMVNSITKLLPNTVANLAKWITNQGLEKYVDEFIHWHNNTINPCEIQATAAWFGEAAQIVGKKYGLTQLNIAQIHYDKAGAESKMRPQPDTARYVTSGDLSSLAKKDNLLDVVEDFLQENRKLFENEFSKLTSPNQAVSLLRMFEQNVVRLALSKPLHTTAPLGFPTGTAGKFDAEKLTTMQANWLKFIEAEKPVLAGVALSKGIHIDGGDDESGEEELEVGDAG
jgi:hypothetical protein